MANNEKQTESKPATRRTDIGMFGKTKRTHSADMSYKPDVQIEQTYQSTTPASSVAKAEIAHAASVTAKANTDARKTMRIPEEQFYELQALLELSSNKYIYELIAELTDARVREIAKDDPEMLRSYQSIVTRIRQTDQRKKSRKTTKK
ncbi:hypothetical protein [Lacticaseibacillus sharpeae]|jgi:hypothetical protein|nr:hypothetical protein [Lacticaseibacillus sharpeae]